MVAPKHPTRTYKNKYIDGNLRLHSLAVPSIEGGCEFQVVGGKVDKQIKECGYGPKHSVRYLLRLRAMSFPVSCVSNTWRKEDEEYGRDQSSSLSQQLQCKSIRITKFSHVFLAIVEMNACLESVLN